MIETAADARRLASACRYAPEGARSFGPVRARLAWGDGYAAAANREILPIAMIETRAAIDNLDAIAATPGLAGPMSARPICRWCTDSCRVSTRRSRRC